MLVIILIIILLTTTVAFQFPSLYRNYLLTGTAQDIILTIREAQQYSTNVKATGSTERYGVYFDATTKQMIFFLDTGGTARSYDAGTDQIIKQTDFDPSLSFMLRPTPVGGAQQAPTKMSIVFDRPNLAPIVYNQTTSVLYSSVDRLWIGVTGPEKSTTVEIYPTGTITAS